MNKRQRKKLCKRFAPSEEQREEFMKAARTKRRDKREPISEDIND